MSPCADSIPPAGVVDKLSVNQLPYRVILTLEVFLPDKLPNGVTLTLKLLAMQLLESERDISMFQLLRHTSITGT